MSALVTVLTYVVAVLTGAGVALRFIAPLTKTTLDDKALVYLDDVLALLQKLGVDPAHAEALKPAEPAAK